LAMHLICELPPVGRLRSDHARKVCPGALVSTVRKWPGGIYRAEVSGIVTRGGRRVAVVCGQEWLPSELIVLRPPAAR
jgi:hypothetical protein